MKTRVSSLHIYPVKSCAGIDLDVMEIGPRGPLHDREWMIVDADTNDFITQREAPGLALIKTQLSKENLTLMIPDVADVSVALRNSGGDIREVTIFKEKCKSEDSSPEASTALSQYLGREVKLVRIAPDFKRLRFGPKGFPDAHTGFADGYPLLIASMDSLADLNTRLEKPVTMDRFRPNIVVEGTTAFAEDGWKRLRAGGIEFDVTKACIRCIIITTDQKTAERGKEPLRTLAGFHRTLDNKPTFGQNLIHLGQGLLRRGDAVVPVSQ